MKAFLISVSGKEFHVEPGLHENLYEVSSGGKQFLIGKREDGAWEVMLPDSDQVDVPAQEIGEAIEAQRKTSGL